MLVTRAFVICTLVCGVRSSAVDDFINVGIGCHHIPGLAVAVVKDGKVVHSNGYGVKNVNTHDKVTNTTLFEIASLTKAFTATLLLKVLNEHSSYSVSTNLYHILGRHKFNNTLRSTYATIEDLLAHRMGIPRNNYVRLDTSLTRSNLVDRVKYLPSKGGFRDSFYYSDLMYGLATRITEIVSGKTWEDAMTENIFKPLHMDASSFGTKVNFHGQNMATPYAVYSGKVIEESASFVQHWAKLGGSGAIVTNAEDMAKWMLFQLNGGKSVDGKQIIDKDLLKDTHKPRNALSSSSISKYFSRPFTPVTMSNNGYALGWKTGYYRGLPILQHSGSTFGYRSFLTLIPDKNIGIFMAMTGTDNNYYFRGALTTYLADTFLGLTPWVNNQNICTFPAPFHTNTRRRSSKTLANKRRRRASHHLSTYAGTYRNEAYGNIDVHYDSQSHHLKVTYGIGSWTLTSSGGNGFSGEWDKPCAPDIDFDFNFKASGSHVYALTPSFEPSSPPVFFRVGASHVIIGK